MCCYFVLHGVPRKSAVSYLRLDPYHWLVRGQIQGRVTVVTDDTVGIYVPGAVYGGTEISRRACETFADVQLPPV